MDQLMQNQAFSTFYRDMEIASTAIYISLALALVYTLIYLYLMSNCAHMLAYVAIGLIEILFIAGIAGAIFGSTRVSGHEKTGYFIGAGVAALGFLLFNCMMWCYWQKL